MIMRCPRFAFVLFIMLILPMATVGCGGGDGGDNPGSASAQNVPGNGPTALDGTAGAPLNNLAPGTYALTLSGAIESDGTWSNSNRPGVFYDPWVRGNNSGPYQLLMRVDLSGYNIEGSYRSPDEGEVLFVFPAGLSPGTYDLVGLSSDAPDGAIQAEVRAGTGSSAQGFDEQVDGTITFEQTGAQVSGAFDFSAVFELFARSTEHTVEAQGQFSAIPFEPEAEANLQFNGAVDYTAETHGVYLEENDNFQVTVDEHRLQVFIGQPGNDEEGYGEVEFYIPAALGEGTYDVVATQNTGVNRPSGADVAAEVAVQAPGMEDRTRADSVSGTLTIESSDPENYAVAFDLTCSTSAGDVQVSGYARYLER